MATIRTSLKQLRNADVRFISLVDRSASRIPFRVVKRDKESKMGIDLTRVFKSDSSVKPHVSSLVVFAQKDEGAAKQIAEAIGKYGFQTDRVQKSDEGETLVYAQGDQPKESVVVRLSDQLLVTVAGLKTPGGWIGEMVEEYGFIPDLKTATSALHDQMQEVVSKSEAPQDDAVGALTNYAEYMSQLAILPTNCFALNTEIAEIVKKCACAVKDDGTELESGKESEEGREKRRVKDPSEKAPVDEEDDQKPPPGTDYTPVEEAKKTDAILAALKGIETTVSGLATKLETVATEQGKQKKVLDDVVQKADTFATTLKTTVTAVPASEDVPSLRMRVQKADDDPRTGNFDTAFIRKRNR